MEEDVQQEAKCRKQGPNVRFEQSQHFVRKVLVVEVDLISYLRHRGTQLIHFLLRLGLSQHQVLRQFNFLHARVSQPIEHAVTCCCVDLLGDSSVSRVLDVFHHVVSEIEVKQRLFVLVNDLNLLDALLDVLL